MRTCRVCDRDSMLTSLREDSLQDTARNNLESTEGRFIHTDQMCNHKDHMRRVCFVYACLYTIVLFVITPMY